MVRRRAWGALMALVIGLAAAAPAGAGFDEGMAARARGDHASAMRELRPLAEQGDADAQWLVGIMYELDEGVPNDYANAAKWYRWAAEQGHLAAQSNLGTLYQFGRGVAQDDVVAHMWYSLAASRGHALAVAGQQVTARHMTPAQLSECRKMVGAWLKARSGKRI